MVLNCSHHYCPRCGHHYGTCSCLEGCDRCNPPIRPHLERMASRMVHPGLDSPDSIVAVLECLIANQRALQELFSYSRQPLARQAHYWEPGAKTVLED